MSNVTLPLAAALSTGTAAPVASAATATVLHQPPGFPVQVVGSLLTGISLGRDAKGSLLLQTELGTLSLQTQANPAVGSKLTLEVQSVGSRLQLIVLRTEPAPTPPMGRASGAPLTAGPAANPPAPASASTAPAVSAAATAPRADVPAAPATPAANVTGSSTAAIADSVVGRTFTAGVVLASSSPAVTPQGQPVLRTGTEVSVRVVSIDAGAFPGTQRAGQVAQHVQAPPSNPIGIQQLANTTAQAITQVPAAATPAVQDGAGPAARPASGSAARPASGTLPQAPTAAVHNAPADDSSSSAQHASTARTAATTATAQPAVGTLSQTAQTAQMAPPPHGVASAAGPAAAPAAPTPVAGVVAGSGPAGETILSTPLGVLSLGGITRLPVGTTMMLDIASRPSGPAASPAVGDGAALPLARAWSPLAEALELVLRQEPIVAQQVLDTAVAQTGPRLASGLMFFLAALRQGDLAAWLGDVASRAIERHGRGDLLARMTDDFIQMARLATDPQTTTGPGQQDWRLMLLPLFDDGVLHQMRLWVRGEPNEGSAADREEDDTRFLLEVELSRLGPMQLDGLVRRGRFDLILRTQHTLPNVMQDDIRTIFDDALAVGGYDGALTFQATRTFPIVPLRDLMAGTGGVLA